MRARERPQTIPTHLKKSTSIEIECSCPLLCLGLRGTADGVRPTRLLDSLDWSLVAVGNGFAPKVHTVLAFLLLHPPPPSHCPPLQLFRKIFNMTPNTPLPHTSPPPLSLVYPPNHHLLIHSNLPHIQSNTLMHMVPKTS